MSAQAQNFEIFENKKDMKPFHIDRELECPILFKNVLSCLRTSYPVLEHPNTVLEHLFLLCPVLSRILSRFLAVPARPVPWQDF